MLGRPAARADLAAGLQLPGRSKLAKLELRAPIFAGFFHFGVVGGTPESCKMYASRKPPYKIHEDLRWGGWSVQENFQYISLLYDIFM